MICSDTNISLTFTMIGVMLWLIPVFLDWKFRHKQFRLIRWLTWTFGFIGLALFYLDPYVFLPGEKEKAAILDKSFENKKDSLYRKGFSVITHKTKDQLFSKNLDLLALYGAPLSPWELQTIHTDTFIYIHPKLSGIVDFDIPKQIPKGGEFELKFTISASREQTLFLTDSEVIIDSVSVNTGTTDVSFKLTAKAAGNFIYEVIGLIDTDTLTREPVPIVVKEAKIPSVLILNSNPSFESKFIKNHFTRLGYPIAVRTRISKDLDNREFVNFSEMNLRYLSDKLFSGFDLVILDPQAFDQLSPAEQQTISERVKMAKLGLFILPSGNDIKNIFQMHPQKGNEIKQTLPGYGEITSTPYQSEELLPITLHEVILGYSKPYGIGNISFSSIQNLYEISLKGNQKIYSRIIRELIQPLLPKTGEDNFFYQKNCMYLNERSELIFTSGSDAPTVYINGELLPVRESAFRPNLYEVTFWPAKPGWNSLLIMPDSTSYDFYVFKENEWLTKKLKEQSDYIEKYVLTHQSNTSGAFIRKKYFSHWIYLLLFIASMTFLWIEQRFLSP